MDVIVPNGYRYVDESHILNENTGEIEEAIYVVAPYSTSFSTPEDKERKRKAKEKRINHETNRWRGGEKYFFIRSDISFGDVSPAMVTRLIYLSTYANYSDDTLMLTRKTKMKRSDLSDVIGLSKRHTANFWKEIYPIYVMENEDGTLVLNGEIFKRGRLKRKSFTAYQQFYDMGVRKLYEAVNGKYHKQLGYLFKLLPFINVEYNLVCHNPFETNIDKVELLSIAEFCRLIGFDISHIGRLLQVYNSVRFEVNGRQERFCTMIYDGLNEYNAKICINPNVFYAGSNIGRIEVTKLFFKD